jgi:hypothetical protein
VVSNQIFITGLLAFNSQLKDHFSSYNTKFFAGTPVILDFVIYELWLIAKSVYYWADNQG